MNGELLAALRDTKPWLDRFNRKDYAQAFRDYAARYARPWREVLRDAEPSALAEELADAVGDGWRQERFWNRSARRFEEKQMVVAYFAPMLLDTGEETFAEAFRSAWAARWPKDTWETAPFKRIRSGFRNTFMGIEMGPRRYGDGDDED